MAECLATLKQNEEWFWEQTPRKIFCLINERKRIETENNKQLAYYIIALLSGIDINNDDDEVLGVDKPVTPEQLKTLGL